MSQDELPAATDLIRWTFTVSPEVAEAVETHLADLGADVFVRDGRSFHVTWDEPETDLDPVVEAIWELAGEHFEITQEEFHRLALHLLHHDSGEEAEAEDEETEPEPDHFGRHAAPEAFHPGVDSLEIREL